MRISDWSSDVCSSDLPACAAGENCRGRLRSPPSARGDDRRDWPADTEGRVVTVQAIYKPASREVLLVLSGEYRVLPEAEAASAARALHVALSVRQHAQLFAPAYASRKGTPLTSRPHLRTHNPVSS